VSQFISKNEINCVITISFINNVISVRMFIHIIIKSSINTYNCINILFDINTLFDIVNMITQLLQW